MGIVGSSLSVDAVTGKKPSLRLAFTLTYSLSVYVKIAVDPRGNATGANHLQLWGPLLYRLSDREHLGELVDIFLCVLADHAVVFGHAV